MSTAVTELADSMATLIDVILTMREGRKTPLLPEDAGLLEEILSQAIDAADLCGRVEVEVAASEAAAVVRKASDGAKGGGA